jgi:hypothetical protein
VKAGATASAATFAIAAQRRGLVRPDPPPAKWSPASAPRLRPFRDETGRELLDLPDAPRTDPDTPAPVRFLPQDDNLTLSHADRSHVAGDAARRWPAGQAREGVDLALFDNDIRIRPAGSSVASSAPFSGAPDK